jgi:monoamine oxidase/SAM-dependent methyltransferase
MVDIAIVGGGPGGLMTAWHLKKKVGNQCRVTIFEASERLGGKILTEKFDSVPVPYEAGVAELYDYSMSGPDPLRDMITNFGHQTIPMDAESVVMDGEMMHGVEDVRRRYGDSTAGEILKFRDKCVSMITPQAYYEGIGKHDNDHPWSKMTAEELLDREIADPVAKRFIKTMARSDIATESHLTNGLNALKNYVMDVDGYIGVYKIQNGNDKLIESLADGIDAEIQLKHRVLKVGRTGNGRYRINMMNGKGPEDREFDLVLMCLPHNWLATVQWDDEDLRQAMVKHIAYFDRPAHYLRVSVLFDEPFWGDQIPDSWFMSESFGGCCVYVPGPAQGVGKYGVLNWLIAGADALAFSTLDDKTLIEQALKTLPKSFGKPFDHFIEGKVHRWMSAVNAIPGGAKARDVMTNHRPDQKGHPGLVLVGDYLFDSTLNGLLDSSDVATDIIVSQVLQRNVEAELSELERARPLSQIDRNYFDNYRGAGPYAASWRQFSDPDYLLDLVETVWETRPKRMLIAGSASGELVGALRERGIDAYGIENNRYIHAKTPKALRKYNRLGTVADLPFKDGFFDVVYETCLCHLAERSAPRAVRELHRVARRGLIFGSVTSDLPPDLVRRYDLLRGVKKLATWWEWSELFFDNDFDLAARLNAPEVMAAVWARTLAAGKGPGSWYADDESLRYCLFDKVVDPD